ncbi:MAG: polysaccharide biosynthesis/export family protein, partial [Bacteroidetes bacterium]|nr:polysaccharide biosynthesis/export family protein [Bacteroidota bacterium]
MNTRILLIFALGLSSCSVFRPSLMLRAGRDFPFAPITDTASPTYRIAPNDIIQFRILSNDGFKLIDFNAFGDNTNWGSQQAINYQTYVIDNDGTAKLPLLGKTSLAGMTLREAEQFLEGIYSTFYNKPFVMVNVTNRRVIIFPGGDGTA